MQYVLVQAMNLAVSVPWHLNLMEPKGLASCETLHGSHFALREDGSPKALLPWNSSPSPAGPPLTRNMPQLWDYVTKETTKSATTATTTVTTLDISKFELPTMNCRNFNFVSNIPYSASPGISGISPCCSSRIPTSRSAATTSPQERFPGVTPCCTWKNSCLGDHLPFWEGLFIGANC